MKFPRRLSLFRSIKFAPFALISLFLFSNLTGVLFSRVMAPAAAATEHTGFQIPADIPTSGDPQLDRIIFEVGEKQGVDPRFIHAVIWQESKYQTKALSHAGAQGLMQLIPATAKRFGCDDPNDPVENITAGTKYLSWLLKRFSGNVELALAAYNAGEGAVDKYDGIPPYNETQNYVKIISRRYGKTYHPILSPAEAAQVFQLHTVAAAD
ncbi:MAG TPA: lytic transglycosylase domain-containing protein [Pyrinomonadaceae bacterium]|nr:lytic transglycosylase domain-containing protein [Pyrinomonadaceae bacterium]